MLALSALQKASAQANKKKKLFQSSLLPEGLKSVNSEHEILIRKQKKAKHSWQHKQTLFSLTEFPNLHGNLPFHYSTETFTHVVNEREQLLHNSYVERKIQNLEIIKHGRVIVAAAALPA